MTRGSAPNALRRFVVVAALLAAAWLPAASLPAVLLIGSPCAGQDAAPAPSRGTPLPVILWRYGAEPYDAAFHRAVKDLGLDAVSLSRVDDPAGPQAAGLSFYADQLAGKGFYELREPEWREVFDRYWKTRDPRQLLRPTSLADPAARETAWARVDAALDRLADARPLFASLADEASSTRHANPLDLCADPHFQQRFRDWLAARHGGRVAELNARWGTSYDRFEAVEPWTTARIRARELAGSELPANLAPWGDQLEFTDRLFAEAVAGGLRRVADRAPELPCGLFGIPQPAPFGGHDFGRLLPGMSCYEAYDIAGARDLADCLAAPAALRVATVFAPTKGGPAPRMLGARFGDLLAHGTDAVIVWSAGGVLGRREDAGGGAAAGAPTPTPFGRALAQTVRDFRPVAQRFAGARVQRDPVWIVESQASIRAQWMLDSARDGRTWPRRFSSHHAAHGTDTAARRSWLQLCGDLGYQPRFVDARRLAELLATPSARPRLIILPATLALSDTSCEALRAFVVAGGVLLADHSVALFDAGLRRRVRGGLDDLFGVEARSVRWADLRVREGVGADSARLGTGEAAALIGLRGSIAEPAVDARGRDLRTQVQLEAAHGRGRAVLLNLAVCEYGSVRLSPEEFRRARALRRRVRRVFDLAALRPRVQVRGAGLPTCLESLHLRSRNGGQLFAVRVAALDSPDLMRQLAAEGARPVEVRFPVPVRLRELTTGHVHAASDRFEIGLDVFRGAFFEVLAAGEGGGPGPEDRRR